MTSGPATAPAGGRAASPAPAGALLSLNNVEVIYDDVILVLRGLSLAVPQGKIVALLGSNGAGKSTTLKAVSGLLPSEHGEVTDGSVFFEGHDITRMDAAERVKLGMSLCMEGRHVFEHLTVAENLVAGSYTQKADGAGSDLLAEVYDFFPVLADMRGRVAGYLSGGEQQMLAICRGLMLQPVVLMLDEPSLGLAPKLVDEIFATIRAIASEGMTILLVEQNVREALELADRAYVLQTGRTVLEGTGRELLDSDLVRRAYLGI